MKTKALRHLVQILLIFIALAPVALAQTSGSAADSASIAAIVAELDSAWANADADRWAAHYVPDAGFINVLGMLTPNMQAMRARHDEIFHGVFHGSRHHGKLRRLRFFGAEAAIADVDIELTGFSALPPGSRPTEPGVLRMRHVLQNRRPLVDLVATQNTAVAPRTGL